MPLSHTLGQSSLSIQHVWSLIEYENNGTAVVSDTIIKTTEEMETYGHPYYLISPDDF